MSRRFARIHHSGRTRFCEVADGQAHLLVGAPYSEHGATRTGEHLPLEEASVRAPVEPTKIVCVGRNYRAHAEELGNKVPKEPLLFLKPPSSLTYSHVALPPQSERVEHEVELGLIIGRRASRISEQQASTHIFGYTIVGDITARDLQRRDKTWTRGKGFDTFCPAGPWLVTDVDVSEAAIECSVNGHIRQIGNTSQMIFSPSTIVAYASRVMTLESGDLIATGTPAGVGPLRKGDNVVMSIAGLGELKFSVGQA